ncbi:MAG: bifunctional alpha/beta hydrolase/OsmC family protein [Bacteroidota bacterium]
MKSTKVTFTNKEGIELSGRIELPIGGVPKAFALFAHCFTCSKNFAAVTNISRALTQNDIGVLRFDFTGLGDSSGDFSDTNFSSNVDDLVSAAEFLEKEYEAPKIMIGHSLGGTATLQASSLIGSAQAVATIGSPADPPHVKHLFSKALEDIKEQGYAEVNIGGRPFKIKKHFLDDLEKNSLKSTLPKLDKALLFIHSPQDEIVEVDNAAKLYGYAKHPKSFISLDGADHMMSNKQDSLYAGSIIASWAIRYIDIKEKEALKSEKQVSVRTGEQGYTTEVRAGQHMLTADEPESVGGNDLGPTPYGYLLASLGSCTSMTLRMYADHKKWNLKEIRVHLGHKKVHAEDCDHCEEKDSKIDRIEREIEIFGDLDEGQKKRLLEIADKCPVHKTLHNDVEIISTLKQ